MKVPKFLKPIIAVMVCISLIRAANNAGEISLDAILIKIQSFEYTPNGFISVINYFRNGEFADGFASWNNNLSGIEGFFINMKNIIISYYTVMWNTYSMIVTNIWNAGREIVDLILKCFDIVLYILGFDIEINQNGFRGGR